jgi:hypothetical protein
MLFAGGANGTTGNLLISIFGPNRILPALVQRSVETKVYTFFTRLHPDKKPSGLHPPRNQLII